MTRRIDFGDRVAGRVVDDQDFRPLRPARHVIGVVDTLFPQAPRIVGVRTDSGEPVTVRLPKGAGT